jgi:hypothetical protein
MVITTTFVTGGELDGWGAARAAETNKLISSRAAEQREQGIRFSNYIPVPVAC